MFNSPKVNNGGQKAETEDVCGWDSFKGIRFSSAEGGLRRTVSQNHFKKAREQITTWLANCCDIPSALFSKSRTRNDYEYETDSYSAEVTRRSSSCSELNLTGAVKLRAEDDEGSTKAQEKSFRRLAISDYPCKWQPAHDATSQPCVPPIQKRLIFLLDSLHYRELRRPLAECRPSYWTLRVQHNGDASARMGLTHMDLELPFTTDQLRLHGTDAFLGLESILNDHVSRNKLNPLVFNVFVNGSIKCTRVGGDQIISYLEVVCFSELIEKRDATIS